MMPKAKGDPYFVSCRVGAEEAAHELGVELIWDGPTGLDPAKQNEVVEGWITREVDVIAVSGGEPGGHLDGAAQGARARHQGGDVGRRRGAGRARLTSSIRRRRKASAITLTDEAARLLERQGRVRDHHRGAERGQSEPVDRIHQEARRGEVSRPEAADDPAERRRSRQGLRGNADAC